MAHKKAGGSTKNGRDSQSKRLGVKRFGGQIVKKGEILLRQRGSKIWTGKNTAFGKDFTIYSLISGKVKFHWRTRKQKKLSVVPL